jgi:hypothetical protein
MVTLLVWVARLFYPAEGLRPIKAIYVATAAEVTGRVLAATDGDTIKVLECRTRSSIKSA